MTMSSGRAYLAIPGPSVVPDRVLRAMHRAAPNIYSGALNDVGASVAADLCKLAGTKHHVAIYIANGHGVWEAALSNVLNPDDKALVLATGPFAQGWAGMAGSMNIDCQVIDFGNKNTIDMEKLAQVLAEDKDHRIKAVLAVHVDTGTSVRNDIPAVRRVIDAAGHPALLMVDCIASFGCDVFRMDEWGVDLMVAACQKGLMTPPGIGFVFFNDKANDLRNAATRTSAYWDWRPRATPENNSERFGGTAPTHHIFGLREALDMILEEGLPQVWARHEKLASAYWAAIEAWGQAGAMSLNIADPALRSHAVTAVSIGAPQGTALRDWVADHAGVTLGIGLGMAPAGDPAWHGHFRIGHMGHVNAHMVLGVAGAIDAGMKSLGIPHGRDGLIAASTVLARI